MTAPSTDTLADALPKEQARCRELLAMYKSIPTGGFGAAVIEKALAEADRAASSGDTVEMIRALEALKNLE